MPKPDVERVLVVDVEVDASVEAVWDAWTTRRGAETFFAPRCRIEPRPGGPYEMLFDLDAEPGQQGGEGMRVLGIQPRHMLAFTWNAPPSLPAVRNQMTHVIVRLHALGPRRTRITLRHDGWGTGDEWDRAFSYFERAWKRVVFPRLKYRFEVGPIDWDKPPEFDA
jgi:uncharacterized protein YndB with AHSA1/START domain